MQLDILIYSNVYILYLYKKDRNYYNKVKIIVKLIYECCISKENIKILKNNSKKK